MRMRVRSLALLSGLRIWHCHELWCRSQTLLGSHVAVAVALADSCRSDSTPSLGTSVCPGRGPKNPKTKQNKPLQSGLVLLVPLYRLAWNSERVSGYKLTQNKDQILKFHSFFFSFCPQFLEVLHNFVTRAVVTAASMLAPEASQCLSP